MLTSGNAPSTTAPTGAASANTEPASAAPARRLLLAAVVAVASGALATLIATSTPWLGIDVARPDGAPTTTVGSVAPNGGAPRVPVGSAWVALAVGADTMVLEPGDLIEEPDFIDDWATSRRFFQRQQRLATMLAHPTVTLLVQSPEGARATVDAHPVARPWQSLPATFWFQLVIGLVGCLIGTWVWALRPREWGTRAFAVTGGGFLLFTHAAAAYSARELALPGTLFRALSAANHLGALIFGAALCVIFLVYPRRLVGTRAIGVLVAGMSIWWMADTARLAPDQNWASRYPVMLEMLAALLIAAVQWRRSAANPAARAVLRWFAASVLLGPGLFIALVAASAAVGTGPVIPQAYAFGFFLLTYVGLALGLHRYRLFDLDAWATRVLFWGAVATLLLLFDTALLRIAGEGSVRALTVVLVLGTFTIPMRQWVWTHVLHRPVIDPEQLVDQALGVAYSATDEERAQRWRQLLQQTFDPLQLAPRTHNEPGAENAVVLRDQGERLCIPAVASAAPLQLTHAGAGRRLFGPADARLADRLVTLLRRADASRTAYEAGVLGERERITRDLHDTVSAPLLAGLAHVPDRAHADGPGDAHDDAGGDARSRAVNDEIRRALGAMRSVVRGTSTPAPLAFVFADVRFESVERLTAAGIKVDWPVVDVGHHVLVGGERDALTAFLRETTSNVLRHAGATSVQVVTVCEQAPDGLRLHIRVRDDGRGLPEGLVSVTDGIANLHARAAALGGVASVVSRTDRPGTEVNLEARLTPDLATS